MLTDTLPFLIIISKTSKIGIELICLLMKQFWRIFGILIKGYSSVLCQFSIKITVVL